LQHQQLETWLPKNQTKHFKIKATERCFFLLIGMYRHRVEKFVVYSTCSLSNASYSCAGGQNIVNGCDISSPNFEFYST
jgi:hypothetical protein